MQSSRADLWTATDGLTFPERVKAFKQEASGISPKFFDRLQSDTVTHSLWVHYYGLSLARVKPRRGTPQRNQRTKSARRKQRNQEPEASRQRERQKSKFETGNVCVEDMNHY